MAGCVLVDCDEGGNAHALHVRAAHEMAGSLWGDHRHVDVLLGLDLREVDRKAVSEHQHRTRLEVLLDRLPEKLALARIWGQHHHNRRL
jgi:hypothetical protein